jgi:hypothetical protein
MRTAWKSIPVGFAILFAIALTGVAQSDKPPVTITVSAPQTGKLGSKIQLDIVLTNVSNHIVGGYFEDLSHGELNFDFDVRDSQGQTVPETCYMKAVEGAPRGSCPDYILRTHKGFSEDSIKPGETVTASADLSQLYDLQPGTYTVQLSWFEKRTRYRDPLKSRPPAGVITAKSNIATVTVTP